MAGNNPTGPLYSLGKLTVAAVGTPVNLNTNVSANTAFGTAGSPAHIVANKITVSNISATGNLFLVYRGATAAANNGIGVVLVIPAGQERSLSVPNLGNPFDVSSFALDTDTAATAGYVVATIY